MPKVTEAHLEARRRQILTAAARCFARRGFHRTTMQDIADQAGISAGAIYRYFEGKESLIEALAAWGRQSRDSWVRALVPGAGPAGLGRLMDSMISVLGREEMGDAAALDVRLWAEALGHPRLRSLVQSEWKALRAPIADYVAGEVAAGRLAWSGPPETLARILLAVITGLELQRVLDPGLATEDAAAVVHAMLGALAVPPPGR